MSCAHKVLAPISIGDQCVTLSITSNLTVAVKGRIARNIAE